MSEHIEIASNNNPQDYMHVFTSDLGIVEIQVYSDQAASIGINKNEAKKLIEFLQKFVS